MHDNDYFTDKFVVYEAALTSADGTDGACSWGAVVMVIALEWTCILDFCFTYSVVPLWSVSNLDDLL